MTETTSRPPQDLRALADAALEASDVELRQHMQRAIDASSLIAAGITAAQTRRAQRVADALEGFVEGLRAAGLLPPHELEEQPPTDVYVVDPVDPVEPIGPVAHIAERHGRHAAPAARPGAWLQVSDMLAERDVASARRLRAEPVYRRRWHQNWRARVTWTPGLTQRGRYAVEPEIWVRCVWPTDQCADVRDGLRCARPVGHGLRHYSVIGDSSLRWPTSGDRVRVLAVWGATS